MNAFKIIRYFVIIALGIIFISCASYLKRRYFKGYYHIKTHSQSNTIDCKNEFNLKKSDNKFLYMDLEVLITSVESPGLKNPVYISPEKNRFYESKQNEKHIYIKDLIKTIPLIYKRNENKYNKQEPEKDKEFFSNKFKKLLTTSVIMIILNIILYLINFNVFPSLKGWGCLPLIPLFFYVLYFYVALCFFILAIIYIIKFWAKEKPKYFYWFIVLSIFNLFLFFILLNGIMPVFPFLGYLGFL